MGKAERGRHGEETRGQDWRGLAWQDRHGLTGSGKALHGLVGYGGAGKERND
jgi:hypothetical protein